MANELQEPRPGVLQAERKEAHFISWAFLRPRRWITPHAFRIFASQGIVPERSVLTRTLLLALDFRNTFSYVAVTRRCFLLTVPPKGTRETGRPPLHLQEPEGRDFLLHLVVPRFVTSFPSSRVACCQFLLSGAQKKMLFRGLWGMSRLSQSIALE